MASEEFLRKTTVKFPDEAPTFASNQYSLIMKKTLTLLLLAAAPVTLFGQRILERTNNSWNHPDLSVETYGDLVFAACSDLNTNTGFLSPMIKVTDVNNNAINSFYLDIGLDVVLMDFVVRPANASLLFTGYLQAAPNRLFVIETDFTGNMLQMNIHSEMNGWEQIPHQIIVSENNQQVVIVGTEIQGILSATNYATVPKVGFILGLDLNNQTAVLYSLESDSPGLGVFDSDMLESVAEVPNGYFIVGSANDPGSNEQNLHLMGIDIFGNVTHTNIWDNTNSRYAGSSVLFSQNGRLYVLANNSVIHQYQIMECDPNTGVLLSNLFSYTPVGFPVGSGIDVNGFRLQETTAGDLLIGGYITCWNTSILPNRLTPFQVTIDQNLGVALDFKLFQSDNNAPLAGYYNESGNSVFINTPDIIAYNQWVNKSYLVNPNSNMGGYDMNNALPIKKSPCSVQYLTNQLIRTPFNISVSTIYPVPYIGTPYQEHPDPRHVDEKKLCTKSLALTNSEGDATLYPNPATESITLTSEEKLQTIRVMDISGAVVATIPGDNRFEWTIDLKALKTGIYILETEDFNGNRTRERFVKE